MSYYRAFCHHVFAAMSYYRAFCDHVDPPAGSTALAVRLNHDATANAVSGDASAVDSQSAQIMHNRLDKPACTMCPSWRLSGEVRHKIHLGPFWKDVAVPGLEDLASRGRNEAEFIYVCANCTSRLIAICEWQIREITEISLQDTTIMEPDASVQRLEKAQVLILSQLKRQCAILLSHSTNGSDEQ
jgi:hypothetical protein